MPQSFFHSTSRCPQQRLVNFAGPGWGVTPTSAFDAPLEGCEVRGPFASISRQQSKPLLGRASPVLPKCINPLITRSDGGRRIVEALVFS